MKGLIACVLKSGGDFVPAHVEWLRRQCVERMPGWEFRCWSDMAVPDAIPLQHDWPKWWAKMQVYRDTGDCNWPALVIDLDTVFLGELKIRPEHEDRAIFLRNPWKDGFRKPEQLAGGFSYLPQWARQKLWTAFSGDPKAIMGRWDGDDQPFLHALFGECALRWQDHYLDQIVSYKAQVKSLGLTADNMVVYFHSTPRPWDSGESWVPPLIP